jgi:acyl-CoA dehydrogenase
MAMWTRPAAGWSRPWGGGWLQHSGGGEGERLDVRSLCLIRETLARHDGAGRFCLCHAGPWHGGGQPVRHGPSAEWLERTRAGHGDFRLCADRAGAGSDVAATATTAVRDTQGWRLNGEKTWISNGGIADVYVIFARTGEAPGAKGLSAFLMPADTPGLSVMERIEVIAPHPLATSAADGRGAAGRMR